ncbi:helix-turn-helix domain-containing protein, partial [Clostridioides difficile]
MDVNEVEIIDSSYEKGKELTEDQCNMVTLLITGTTVTETARIIGVNRKTIYNWMNKEHVRKEMDRRK